MARATKDAPAADEQIVTVETPPEQTPAVDIGSIFADTAERILAKSREGIMLMDPYTGLFFYPDSYTESPSTGFTRERIESKDLILKDAE